MASIQIIPYGSYNGRQIADAALADATTNLPSTSYVCVGDELDTADIETVLRYVQLFQITPTLSFVTSSFFILFSSPHTHQTTEAMEHKS